MSVETRFAHNEGITGITLTSDGTKILTCGSDGDVRIWDGCEDEDPIVFSALDSARGLICHNENVFVGTENNTVEQYRLPKGISEGVKAKFTAEVNHLDITKDGKILVAGSGDMTVQIIKLGESALPKKIESHKGPILSVSIDPLSKYFVTAACDGYACIWNLDNLTTAHQWDSCFPSSNDVAASETLCRVAWSPCGNILAIPHKGCVNFYARESWKEIKKFSCHKVLKFFSVATFSSCGKYLAAGSFDGYVAVWVIDTGKCILISQENRDHITGIIFSMDNEQVYSVDLKGRMLCFKDLGRQNSSTERPQEAINAEKESTSDDTEKDDFDDGLDDLFTEGEVNENEISISRIKAETGFIDDRYVGPSKALKGSIDGDDDAASIISDISHKVGPAPVQQIVNPFTEPQPPFQPSSTPEHLDHRFLAWNNTGTIRNYYVEEDEQDAMDIEFHDASHHHTIHHRNSSEYCIGTLSSEAVVLASKETKDSPSKIFCINITAWDTSKEWTVNLPLEENVVGLAVGGSWIIASTTENRLRLFSLGGVQKGVFDWGGTIIAIAGHEDLLIVAFHNGIGLNGNQNVFYSIVKVKDCKLISLILNSPLPLSPKSTLVWLGFSDEGTPAFSDSRQNLRLLNGHMWITFCSMREMLTGPTDCYWVVGVSETSQNIRAVKCKGMRYPPTLPRPTLLLLDSKLPLCEMSTEKSQYEDVVLKNLMLNTLSKKMNKKGFDIEEIKESSEKEIREHLMKLFGLSCKTGRDFRASEYASLMLSSHAVQIAMKYANKLRKPALVHHLTNIGQQKMEEDDSDKEEDDDDFETVRRLVSMTYMANGDTSNRNGSITDSPDLFSRQQSSYRETMSTPIVDVAENPLLERQKEEIRSILTPGSLRRNPFKKAGEESDSPQVNQNQNESQDNKGLAFIDAWKKPIEKISAAEFNPKHPKSKTAKKPVKDKDGEKKTKKNSIKFDKKVKETPISFLAKKVDENPVNETEENTVSATDKKRKREEIEESDEVEKGRKAKVVSKLALFAKSRQDD